MHPYISLFGVDIPSYTLSLVVGFVLAMLLLLHTHKKRNIPRKDAYLCALIMTAAALVGSKLLFLVTNGLPSANGGNFITGVLLSGFVFYGGLIGMAVAIIFYARKKMLSLPALVDIYALPIAIAHAIGRIGCYMEGCCYGAVSHSPLAVVFPFNGYTPAGVPVLPVQLFEAGFLLILAIFLAILLSKINRPGLVAGAYMTAYACWRFFIEFYRSDPRGGMLGLSTSQWISVLLLPIGVFALLQFGRRKSLGA